MWARTGSDQSTHRLAQLSGERYFPCAWPAWREIPEPDGPGAASGGV